jgi:hypothetical protein
MATWDKEPEQRKTGSDLGQGVQRKKNGSDLEQGAQRTAKPQS